MGDRYIKACGMIYLILSLFTGTWIATIFKLINSRSVRADAVICINYAVGVIAAAFGWIGDSSGAYMGKGFPLMLIVAVILGAFMRINLFFTDKSTIQNGVGSTTFFNRIGFFPCVIISSILWDGFPGMIQTAGLFLVVASMFEMVRSMTGINIRKLSLIIWLICSTAVIELSNKVFSVYFDPELKPLFLLMTFCSAFIVGFISLFKKNDSDFFIGKKELMFGIFLGIPNILNNYFKLKSLEYFPSSVVLASFAVGTMIFSMIIGILMFGEQINKRMMVAVGIAAVSIMMVNF